MLYKLNYTTPHVIYSVVIVLTLFLLLAIYALKCLSFSPSFVIYKVFPIELYYHCICVKNKTIPGSAVIKFRNLWPNPFLP